MQGGPGFLCVVPLSDFLSLGHQGGQPGGIGPGRQGLHGLGKGLGSGIHLGDAGIFIRLDSFGAFQAFLEGSPAVGGVVLFHHGFRLRNERC